MDNVQNQIGTVSQEIKLLRKKSKGNSSDHKTNRKKNAFDGNLIRRLYIAVERISI